MHASVSDHILYEPSYSLAPSVTGTYSGGLAYIDGPGQNGNCQLRLSSMDPQSQCNGAVAEIDSFLTEFQRVYGHETKSVIVFGQDCKDVVAGSGIHGNEMYLLTK